MLNQTLSLFIMKSFKSIMFSVSMLGMALLTSCDGDDPKPALEATIIANLGADPATGFDNMGHPLGTTGKFKLFSFATGAAVANTDSATNNWDIAFRGTTIIVNSGTSGPGTAAAQVVEGIFDEFITAPNAGYLQDNKNTPTYAISDWYNYANQIITPKAGKVIIVKTAQSKYAKFEILSYYKDAPATPTNTDMPRYYKVRYIYQPDGSKNLK